MELDHGRCVAATFQAPGNLQDIASAAAGTGGSRAMSVPVPGTFAWRVIRALAHVQLEPETLSWLTVSCRYAPRRASRNQLDLIAGTRRSPAVTLDGALEDPNTGAAIAPRRSSSPEAAEEALAAADRAFHDGGVATDAAAPRRRARPARRRARGAGGRARADRGDRLRRADRRHRPRRRERAEHAARRRRPAARARRRSRPASSTAAASSCTTSRGARRSRSCRGTRRCRSASRRPRTRSPPARR